MSSKVPCASFTFSVRMTHAKGACEAFSRLNKTLSRTISRTPVNGGQPRGLDVYQVLPHACLLSLGGFARWVLLPNGNELGRCRT